MSDPSTTVPTPPSRRLIGRPHRWTQARVLLLVALVTLGLLVAGILGATATAATPTPASTEVAEVLTVDELADTGSELTAGLIAVALVFLGFVLLVIAAETTSRRRNRGQR